MKTKFRIFARSTAALALGILCCCNPGELPGDPDDSYARRMRSFVKDISSYARRFNRDFIIIPQNGEELAFKEENPENGTETSYINAIDGIGIEELFYNGSSRVDEDRLTILRELKKHARKIMVADYVGDDSKISDSVKKSLDEGFIAFPRGAGNYDYKEIPAGITNENKNNIHTLAGAENYLYLISDDNFRNKSDFLKAVSLTNYDLVLIDLFFRGDELGASDIEQLKTKANGGKRLVISYISVGSAENYRYYWKPGWKKGSPSFLKKNYNGYPDEFWVEYWSPQWRDIIFGNNDSYIKKIIDAGFDGAYLDNVEAYSALVN